MTSSLHALLLMGPTASGKTAAALKLAQLYDAEIVNVDSALVYRDMDIGTAKPSVAEQQICPHHLIDIISPEESYSAARFALDASGLIADICNRGKLPILVGGTMLYFKALREGLSDLPQADAALRAEIETQAHSLGWPALHAQLAQLDPEAALRLNPNDSQRIQRALEIVRLSGRSLAENYALRSQASDTPPIHYLSIALQPSDRAVLHERIARRFEQMLALGLEDEVCQLRARYALDIGMTSMRCVGYRQMWEYLDGDCDRAAMRAKAIAATRQLAKRQITWMRQFRENWPALHEIDCLAPDYIAQAATTLQHWRGTITT